MGFGIRASVVVIVLVSGLTMAVAAEEQPIDVIEDNSFLIEEAYNQEPGVVQHIFNAMYTKGPPGRGWQFSFTQEWPVYGLEHQLSYTIPSYHLVDEGDRQNGIGDVLLNYRYQALEEGPGKPAFAPRFSLILPTGNRNRGTGNGVVGYQWALPFSKKVTPRLALHANLGLTYLPHVQSPLSNGHLSPKRSLVSYYVGGSAIFAILPRLHAMLEWISNFEDDINDAGKAVHAFKPVISPGFRTAVVNEEELQIVLGAAMPIGLNRNSNNFGAFLYFSIEHKLF
ncbi:MAG: transporter [Alphaproteobacteria bacterium]